MTRFILLAGPQGHLTLKTPREMTEKRWQERYGRWRRLYEINLPDRIDPIRALNHLQMRAIREFGL